MNVQSVLNRFKQYQADRSLFAQIRRVEGYLEQVSRNGEHTAPVLIFNASTRIHRLSLNGAYSLLASWALRAKGVPVRYLVCEAGMEQCVLGAALGDPLAPPPCRRCVRLSQHLFPEDLVLPFTLDNELIDQVHRSLASMGLDGLLGWEYEGYHLGEICMPGLQWSLRRTNLEDDEPTRQLLRSFIASSVSMLRYFQTMLAQENPQAVVIFNGIFYPEALLRQLALERGVRVITHEVGLLPFSVFMTEQLATFRKVDLPVDFELDREQTERLDNYLEERFRGRFSMAGVRFWPEMVNLPAHVEEAIQGFEHTVTIFSNVIFDTSQGHANTLFTDMFAWLDELEPYFQRFPETLFILRAHPDEDRPGKSSRQSVADWAQSRGIAKRDNVLFLAPSDYVSSYELIRRSKCVLVYNSSIGIEATILEVPVLMAGRARYSHEPTAYIPQDIDSYHQWLMRFLQADRVEVPLTMVATARRLLYIELFHASLSLTDFLGADPVLPGMAVFSEFEPTLLQDDATLNVIREGILHGTPFQMPLFKK